MQLSRGGTWLISNHGHVASERIPDVIHARKSPGQPASSLTAPGPGAVSDDRSMAGPPSVPRCGACLGTFALESGPATCKMLAWSSSTRTLLTAACSASSSSLKAACPTRALPGRGLGTRHGGRRTAGLCPAAWSVGSPDRRDRDLSSWRRRRARGDCDTPRKSPPHALLPSAPRSPSLPSMGGSPRARCGAAERDRPDRRAAPRRCAPRD